MFESENLAMHELLARSQILLFFGIGLIKIYLIGTKVPVFKNRKKGSISLHPIPQPCPRYDSIVCIVTVVPFMKQWKKIYTQ